MELKGALTALSSITMSATFGTSAVGVGPALVEAGASLMAIEALVRIATSAMLVEDEYRSTRSFLDVVDGERKGLCELENITLI